MDVSNSNTSTLIYNITSSAKLSMDLTGTSTFPYGKTYMNATAFHEDTASQPSIYATEWKYSLTDFYNSTTESNSSSIKEFTFLKRRLRLRSMLDKQVQQKLCFCYGCTQIPQMIFLTGLLLIIVIGNMCVLTAISLSENGRKTRMNYFIMHLAIADLSVGLFLVTLDIGEKIAVDWLAGSFVCKFAHYLKACVLYASTYVLVSLSIDRFDAIARPMNFSRRVFRAKMLIFLAWFLAALFAIPSFILFDTAQSEYIYNGKQMTLCTITKLKKLWHWQVYVTVIAAAAFILPALIIIVCYSIIIAVIWRKSKRQPESISETVLPVSDSVEIEARARHSTASCGVIQQAKIRTVKMTFIIVIVFVLCWCPYFISIFIQVFIPADHTTHEGNALITFMMSVAPLNSAANPIIYGVFSTRICRNLRYVPVINSIAKCVCCCDAGRHRTTSRLSHTSVLDGTYMVDGSVTSKYGFRKPSGIKRAFSESDSCYVSFGRQKQVNGYQMPTTVKSNINNKDSYGLLNKKQNSSDSLRSLSSGGGSRRPSGLPLVQRALSEEESNLLRLVSMRRSNTMSESEM